MRDLNRNGGRRRSAVALGLAVIAGAAALVASSEARAQQANRILTCSLGTTTLNGLTIALQNAGINTPRIDFVVVYTIANPNDGQQIGATSNYTGPVLCGRSTYNTLPPVVVAPTSQTAPIPSEGTVDVLGIENVLITQYKPAGGTAAQTEKQFCHTVGSNNDCFTISD